MIDYFEDYKKEMYFDKNGKLVPKNQAGLKADKLDSASRLKYILNMLNYKKYNKENQHYPVLGKVYSALETIIQKYLPHKQERDLSLRYEPSYAVAKKSLESYLKPQRTLISYLK